MLVILGKKKIEVCVYIRGCAVKNACQEFSSFISEQNGFDSLSWCLPSWFNGSRKYSSPNPQGQSSLLLECYFVFRLFFFFFLILFIYLFMAVLGLRFCARGFSSCGKRGPLFIAVRGPLTIAASLVAENRLQTRRLSNCGSRA